MQIAAKDLIEKQYNLITLIRIPRTILYNFPRYYTIWRMIYKQTAYCLICSPTRGAHLDECPSMGGEQMKRSLYGEKAAKK